VADVFEAAGGLRRLYRQVDWAATPVGSVSSWSSTLAGAVDLMLSTRFAATLLWGPEFVMIYNEAYAELIGVKHPAALGTPAREVFPEIWDTIGPMLRSVNSGGGATWAADLPLGLNRNGYLEECYFTFSYSPVGGTDGVIAIAAETTAHVVGRGRLELLSQLRATLADLDDTAEILAGALALLRVHSNDLPRVEILRPSASDERPRLPARIVSALRNGDFVVDSGADEPVVWARLGPESATGQTPMLKVSFGEHPATDDAYVEFVHLVAESIGQALERVRTRAVQRTAATERLLSETLQHSLLTATVQPDHLQVAVRYQPIASQAQVGGDWYDSFLLPDGCLVLVIGDVSGHDRYAAAAMAQIRNVLRGIAYTVQKPPAYVLARLDDAMDGLAVDSLATAILAQIEQDDADARAGLRTLRWSNAGHPPPILLAPDGAATVLHTPPDMLLGTGRRPDRHDHTVTLEPGSSVVFYTDGCVERRGVSVYDGVADLAAALTGRQHLTAEELCDHVLDHVGHSSDDDLAILVVHAYSQVGRRPAEAGPEVLPATLTAVQH
jgi:serine phosphatase RsbU (regulator of sigma subunit)